MSDVTTACRDVSQLTPNAKTACTLFLTECAAVGLKVLITETYRSQDRQNYLYEQGRTRKGNIVTWTKNSRHTSRRAWDICQNVKGKEFSDKTFFKRCGDIAKRLNITWGGTWKQADTPHFEVSENWKIPINYESEDNAMTDTERKEFEYLKGIVNNQAQQIQDLQQQSAVYNYFDENMPQWIADITHWAVDNGVIHGTGDGLGMTKAKAETLVMIKNVMGK